MKTKNQIKKVRIISILLIIIFTGSGLIAQEGSSFPTFSQEQLGKYLNEMDNAEEIIKHNSLGYIEDFHYSNWKEEVIETHKEGKILIILTYINRSKYRDHCMRDAVCLKALSKYFSEKYPGKVEIKATEGHPALKKYNIRGIPTVSIFCKNDVEKNSRGYVISDHGKPTDSFFGSPDVGKENLNKCIERLIQWVSINGFENFLKTEEGYFGIRYEHGHEIKKIEIDEKFLK